MLGLGATQMRTKLSLLFCLTLASLVAGCSSMADEYCTELCDCVNCNDREFDECVIEYEAAQDIASAYDCDPEFDDAHACVVERNDCIGGQGFLPESSCYDEFEDLDNCEDRGSSLR